MGLSGRYSRAAILLLLGWLMGCAIPSAANPPLTARGAQNTLDSWNPNYCQVVEFYGLHQPGESGASLAAYVLIANPSDKVQKPQIYVAQFQLLTLPNGQQRWYLVSLITHSAGLSKRQGWDNLLVPVKEAEAAGGSNPGGAR